MIDSVYYEQRNRFRCENTNAVKLAPIRLLSTCWLLCQFVRLSLAIKRGIHRWGDFDPDTALLITRVANSQLPMVRLKLVVGAKRFEQQLLLGIVFLYRPIC